jgi:hypothetical protein
VAERRCLNCDAATPVPARFCARCGQRTDTARLAVRDLARDLLQRFVDVERGPLAFARALLVRPGRVAREYVDGRRRRHYGPFATLAVVVGVTALAINLSGFRVLSRDGLSPAPTEFLQRHFNLLLLLQLPLLGAVCAALFRPAKLTLTEHMVLVAYALSVRAVFLALVGPLASLVSVREPGIPSVFAFWVAWYVYFGWAAAQFYAGPALRNWAMGAAAAALGHAAVAALLFGIGAGYDMLVRAG